MPKRDARVPKALNLYHLEGQATIFKVIMYLREHKREMFTKMLNDLRYLNVSQASLTSSINTLLDLGLMEQEYVQGQTKRRFFQLTQSGEKVAGLLLKIDKELS